MKVKKTLTTRYTFTDFEQQERQKRLDDAFDVFLEEIDREEERINNEDEYEQAVTIKR